MCYYCKTSFKFSITHIFPNMSIYKWFLLLVISCILTKDVKAQSLEKLKTKYDQTFSANQPGGSVLIKKGDKTIWQKSFGLASLATNEKVTENTIFNTGSISKTVVAYGILILAERQKLSLDDPINQYFNFENPKVTEAITIRHLLSHTSGLPDARNVRANPTFYLTAKDQENFNPILGISQLNFPAGARFQYSNPAFNGLALIIEKVAEQPWQQFIHEQIFQPAGMTQSKITNGPNPQNGVAHAYVQRGKYIERDYGEEPTFAAAGNGGIWCSILDLAKYEHAIQHHLFANPATVQLSRQIFRPENWENADNPAAIGLSWFIKEKESQANPYGVDIYSHTGSQGGFRSFYISIPEKDLLYIALFNRPISNMNELMWEGLALLKQENWLE